VNEMRSLIELVDTIVDNAITSRASDIHIEPLEHGLRVRYRIDGILYDRELVHKELMLQVISRIKVISNIDIAEKRIPQDGSFSRTYLNRLIDFRVSTFPSIWGEKLVVRILDRAHTAIALDALGLSEAMLNQCKEIVEYGAGIFLVTGPTGSGKTTTLYAALSYLNTPERHIITLEDPVEYNLQGITQGQIHVGTGFTFAKGLRALLRQDPDILMVGEIRDKETAQIAIEAALTGHLVVSTVHTADAPRVIMRLLDMQIEAFKISASVIAVLAQRLARVLCPHCKAARTPKAQEEIFLAEYGKKFGEIYEATGCDLCHGIEYSGRIGIFQLLIVTEKLRTLLMHNPSLDQIVKSAQDDGMKTLYSDG